MVDHVSPGAGQIAVIGDLHAAWDDWDVAYFNQCAYAALVFTGDLGASTRQDGARIAKLISRLEAPVLVMPGNNDARHYNAIAAELAYRQGAKSLLRGLDKVAQAPLAQLCGFSSHHLALGPEGVTVIAGRPFSMGGPTLTFAEELKREFGVSSLEESAARIAELAAAAPTRDLILLSHNGPTGLGDRADSLWGRDFAEPSADWGDRDLAQAFEQMQRSDTHRVLAVIAGHMHSPTRAGAPRTWQAHLGGVLHVNPARVPRIFEHQGGREARHHVALSWSGSELIATEQLVYPERE